MVVGMTAAIASLTKTLCCVGINNGSDVQMFGWLPPEERDNWIADFRRDPIVCEDGRRDSLELVIDGYEALPVSKLVMLTLRRKGYSTPVFCLAVNNANLHGKPELQWADLDLAGG